MTPTLTNLIVICYLVANNAESHTPEQAAKVVYATAAAFAESELDIDGWLKANGGQETSEEIVEKINNATDNPIRYGNLTMVSCVCRCDCGGFVQIRNPQATTTARCPECQLEGGIRKRKPTIHFE